MSTDTFFAPSLHKKITFRKGKCEWQMLTLKQDQAANDKLSFLFLKSLLRGRKRDK